MRNVTQQIKEGAAHAFESLAEGWRDLRSRAGEALTRFHGASRASTGAHGGGEPWDERLASFGRWGFMAADVVEDDRHVVVRLEAPGMRRDDFKVTLHGSLLTVEGDKQVDRELEQGGWHISQCAYGSFRRDVQLPVAVEPDRCKATYRDGVLRIELAKAESARPRRLAVAVH